VTYPIDRALDVTQEDGMDCRGNALPAVLRGWFGENAGQPGTAHRVIFIREGEAYRMEAVRGAE
jgi:hypothetical protein